MSKTLCLLAAGVVMAAALPRARAVAAAPQQTAEAVVSGYTGSDAFKSYCGSCHGTSARGDGPLANELRYRPADLTRIAKRNGGKFDGEQVFRIIDGRKPVKGHGGTDMPVWGDAFRQSVDGYSEASVKARIQSLVDYLASVQVQ
jgi:mono/diheme cytochrome c family protein